MEHLSNHYMTWPFFFFFFDISHKIWCPSSFWDSCCIHSAPLKNLWPRPFQAFRIVRLTRIVKTVRLMRIFRFVALVVVRPHIWWAELCRRSGRFSLSSPPIKPMFQLYTCFQGRKPPNKNIDIWDCRDHCCATLNCAAAHFMRMNHWIFRRHQTNQSLGYFRYYDSCIFMQIIQIIMERY